MSEFTKVLLSGTISYNRESFPFIYMLNGVSRPECISLMSLLEKTNKSHYKSTLHQWCSGLP